MLYKRSFVKYLAASFVALGYPHSLRALIEESDNIEVLHTDFCILGAEPFGLYSASKLQALGHKVLVLEKTSASSAHAPFLKDDLILDVTLELVVRPADKPIIVIAKTPSKRIAIQTKKILVSFPPLLSNMSIFDLDVEERNIFSQFSPHSYGTSAYDTQASHMNHSPYGLYVSWDEIKQSSFNRLSCLQGKKSTYFLGTAIDSKGACNAWMQADQLIRNRLLTSN